MTNKLLLIFVCLCSLNYLVWAESYCQTELFRAKVSKAGKPEKVVYTDGIDEYRDKKKLHLLISQPEDNLLQGKRPAVIFVHGGGFMECIKGGECYEQNNEDLVRPEFTERGFVTISVEYRLNKFNPLSFISNGNLVKAHIRAIEDVRNAVKFVFDNAEKFNIDDTKIFLSGYSAGAISILHAAFLDEQDISQTVLKDIDKLAPRQKIRGLIPISGSIYELEYIDSEEKTPTLLIHGKDDFIVPFKSGKYFNNFFFSKVYGSSRIAEWMIKQGNQPETFFIEGMGHNFNTRQKEIIAQTAADFIRKQLGCKAENKN